MATDAQSLLSAANTAGYDSFGNGAGEAMLLELALLQIIANALNASAATDAQSLFASANVAGYNSFGNGRGEAKLIELALLQNIANRP